MNSSITSRGIQNTATRRSSEKKHTRSTNNQDFTMKALSKQNTEALLASLSCSSFQAATERSAIFAFGVLSDGYRLSAEAIKGSNPASWKFCAFVNVNKRVHNKKDSLFD